MKGLGLGIRATLWSIGLALAPAAGVAQDLDVPPGFEVTVEPSSAVDGSSRGLLTVRPEGGMFSDLSTLSLHEVASDVDDPEVWLKERMSVEFHTDTAADEMLFGPDSPFGDPAFDGLRDALPKLFAGLQDLSRLPLDFCEEPERRRIASGPVHEMSCVFELGPFRQFMILRLQEVDDRWYYIRIRAMNERRLRHLIAIANTFEP